MYRNNPAPDGSFNVCGKRVMQLRMALKSKTSQRLLADKLQEVGLNLDKNAIQQIEAGKRFVSDVELKGFARFFGVTADELLE